MVRFVIAVGFAIALLGLAPACASGPPTPPDGVTTTQLVEEYVPGMVIRTTRTFSSTEEVNGTTATASREDVYRTLVEQVGPRGEPVAGERIYDRAWLVLDTPTVKRRDRAEVDGQRIRFRPGRPAEVVIDPTVENPAGEVQQLPDDVAVGMRLEPFDAVFLPHFPAWQGAEWEPAKDRLQRLNHFLRQLGLAPDQQQIRIRWSATRDVETPTGDGTTEPHRGAVLDIRWTASGLMPTRTGRPKTARVDITGSVLFDLDDKLITSVSLGGRAPGNTGSFRIALTRRVLLRGGEERLERESRQEPDDDSIEQPDGDPD